jgi:hypothetical protein
VTIRLTVESRAHPHGEHVAIPGSDAVLTRDGDWLVIDTGIEIRRIRFASISEQQTYLDIAATIRANEPHLVARATATLGQLPAAPPSPPEPDLVLRRDPAVNSGNDFWTWQPPQPT